MLVGTLLSADRHSYTEIHASSLLSSLDSDRPRAGLHSGPTMLERGGVLGWVLHGHAGNCAAGRYILRKIANRIGTP